MTERLALQLAIAIGSLVPITAGAAGVLLGPSVLAIFGANFFSLKMPRPAPVHIAGTVFTTVQLAIIAIAVVAMLLILSEVATRKEVAA